MEYYVIERNAHAPKKCQLSLGPLLVPLILHACVTAERLLVYCSLCCWMWTFIQPRGRCLSVTGGRWRGGGGCRGEEGLKGWARGLPERGRGDNRGTAREAVWQMRLNGAGAENVEGQLCIWVEGTLCVTCVCHHPCFFVCFCVCFNWAKGMISLWLTNSQSAQTCLTTVGINH